MSQDGFRAALIQLLVGKDRAKNLENAGRLIDEAKTKGAQVVALPECFNSPYGTKFFDEYAESIPDGPTSKMLAACAKKNSIYLIGGTFPERDNGKLYNTCTVYNPEGDLIAKFRKVHLFDIDIPGGITFKESEILHGGDEIVTFDINDVTVGLGICYDLRFEEFAKLYRKKGCKLLIYPGAFNMTTGPLHWELLQRARALDNQLYVFAISPARGEQGYIAWGHSQVTDPWGKVVIQAQHGEEIIYADLDFNECDKKQELIKICEILAEEDELQVTIAQSLIGACYAFGGAVVGGLLGGPIGLGVGGAAGSALGAYKGQGKYKSAVHVIMYDMSERQKQRLATAVQNVIRGIDASDVITVIAVLNSNNALRDLVIAVIKRALVNDMGMRIV